MKINLDAVKTFFDPHPGFAGALEPISPAVKKVADELNGTTTSLNDAVAKIKAVTTGNVEICKDFILLETKGKTQYGNAVHTFRVIRFK